MSWARTKAGTEPGAMPAKVSLNMRATVTAGLAKLVDEVNQYAAPIHAATLAVEGRRGRCEPGQG